MSRYPGDPYTVEDVVEARTAELREKLRVSEQSLSEYKHAVQNTAATADAALGRLIAAQVIVDAAYALVDDLKETMSKEMMAKPGARLLRELIEAVDLHRRGLPS